MQVRNLWPADIKAKVARRAVKRGQGHGECAAPGDQHHVATGLGNHRKIVIRYRIDDHMRGP